MLRQYFRNNLIILLTALMAVATAFAASAAAPEAYAGASKLKTGRWIKVKIPATGMYCLSTKQLKAMGFTDVSKVNVYGYGGRVISEQLDGNHPDDLPMQPVVRTSKGIVFFGVDATRWGINSAGSSYFVREENPYDQYSYYFVSDVAADQLTQPTADASVAGGSNPQDTFIDHILYEQSLAAPSNTGRTLLGEDFRSTPSRKFSFSLPGNTGDATVRTVFGAYSTNGTSTLTFTANGTKLETSSSDRISTVGESFISYANTSKVVANPGEKLDYEIKFTTTGALTLARLDYIIVEYPRRLAVTADQLVFNTTKPATVAVANADEWLTIWDVTRPESPAVVDYQLIDGKAVFTVNESGYREYVAFYPDKVSTEPTRDALVANQDIHGMAVPDMLIVSPSDYLSEAKRLAEFHAEHDGLKVHVLTPQTLYNEFSSGTADLSAFRKALKMWFDRGEENGSRLRYCLMMGRGSYDNLGVTSDIKNKPYQRLPLWQSASGNSQLSSYSTDDILAMLQDWTPGWSMSTADLDIGVGRMPVKSALEAKQAVNKVINYAKFPEYGGWRNKVLVIADNGDRNDHLNQSQDLISNMQSTDIGGGRMVQRIYLDTYDYVYTSVGATVPDATDDFLAALNEGAMMVSYIGHADPREWTHEKFFNWPQITSLTNHYLPVFYAATCEFGRWDDSEASGAEEMWLNPTAGAVAFYTPSRKVYMHQNGELTRSLGRVVAANSDYRIGDIYRLSKNGMASAKDENRLRFHLIGDPALKMPMPTRGVEVLEIDGADPLSEDLPIVGALSNFKISGRIISFDDQPAEDFNGILEIVLNDAERVQTTLGNGDGGEETVFNDRKSILFRGRTEVKNGKWEASVRLPLEIENNYSPALFTFYAYDTSKGIEANGTCDRLYVYGLADNIVDDNDGPVIESLVLNGEGFNSGDVVGSCSTMIANVSDPSGINVSNVSLGHSMTLRIDGGEPLADVVNYYLPSTTDPTAGTVSYPLSEIDPGDHTLEFTVWDNAGNSSVETIDFRVAAGGRPEIYDLYTDVNPAVTSVTFILSHDTASSGTQCLIEVFDLSGRLVWSEAPTGVGTTLTATWNLHDTTGNRVARGIYLYRATVTASSGAQTTTTKKLAVAAQ